MSEKVAPELVEEIAPTGTLRAAINYGNPVLAQRGPDGQPAGVSTALAHALARLFGVKIEITTYLNAGDVVDALGGEKPWDIAFVAIDPKRAQTISFTPPYVIIEGAYMVPAASLIQRNEDVDKAGIRIAVGRNTAYDLYLTRNLQHATRIVAPTSPGAIDVFQRDKLEVVASVRQPLQTFAKGRDDVRILPGRFMVIEQAMALPRGRVAALTYVSGFIERMKESGFVAEELKKSGQEEATVAPKAD